MSEIPTRRNGEVIDDTMKRLDGLSAVRRATAPAWVPSGRRSLP